MRALAVAALVVLGACAPRISPAPQVASTRYESECRVSGGGTGPCVLVPRPHRETREPGYRAACLTPPDSVGACVLRDQRATPGTR